MHSRAEFVARRDGVDYVRCLDCDQVLEADDLEPVPVYEDDEPSR
jgi:hypothetical protein